MLSLVQIAPLSYAQNWSRVSLDLPAQPTGNAWATGTALDIQGTTQADDQREFLVSLGLVSNKGNMSRPSPYHDKVA